MDRHSNAQLILSLMDLTSLNESDQATTIQALCQQANTPAGRPAAVCVFPAFIEVARHSLLDLNMPNVRIATVVNFPHGNEDVAIAVAETEKAISLGANEIDVVFPYRALMKGNALIGEQLVQACKQACESRVTLKVILETGVLETAELIELASIISIDAGADFIKTSTGKVPVNATLQAASIMLNAIKKKRGNVGFKAAGGIKTFDEANRYIQLADDILGRDWITPNHFRFGASGLLQNLLSTMGISHQTPSSNPY